MECGLSLAVEYYSAALAVDSNHVRSLVGLAQVRSWQGRHHEAMRLSDRALAIESDNRDARQVPDPGPERQATDPRAHQ